MGIHGQKENLQSHLTRQQPCARRKTYPYISPGISRLIALVGYAIVYPRNKGRLRCRFNSLSHAYPNDRLCLLSTEKVHKGEVSNPIGDRRKDILERVTATMAGPCMNVV